MAVAGTIPDFNDHQAPSVKHDQIQFTHFAAKIGLYVLQTACFQPVARQPLAGTTVLQVPGDHSQALYCCDSTTSASCVSPRRMSGNVLALPRSMRAQPNSR